MSTTLLPLKSGALNPDITAALVGTEGTPSSVNPFVTTSDTRMLGLGGLGGVMAVTELGHGGNGNYDLNGTNTYTGLTLAGSTYTVDAMIILRANNLTIRTSIVLKTAGSPLHVLGTLTLEGTAIISDDGTDGSGTVAGEGAAANLLPTSTTGNTFFGGLDGSTGKTTAVNGASGQSSSSIVICGGLGGTGGIGSYLGSTATGGISYTSPPTLAEHYHGELLYLLMAGRADIGTARGYLVGGAGGGSGGNKIGGGTGTLSSGSGGGGGGVLPVWCSVLNASGSCVIRANGGSAGNAIYGTPGANAGSGGGGGGGGGIVLLKAGSVTSNTLPTIEAKGGNGGNAQSVGAGFGNGGDGGVGGKVICILGNYAGSVPTMTTTGGFGGNGNGTGNSNGAAGTTGTLNAYKVMQ